MRKPSEMSCPFCAKMVNRAAYWRGEHECSNWKPKCRPREKDCDYSAAELDVMLATRKTHLRLTDEDIWSRKQVDFELQTR